MKISIRRQFAERVKELRLASGISQEAFADMCGFVRSYMSRIERAKANPSLDAIKTLSDALNVEVRELFTFSTRDESAIWVPFAKDGTCFNPSLCRPQSKNYTVGKKGAECQFNDFSQALEYLSVMDTAYWRRPNLSGNWGIVSAIKWAELPDEYREKNY